MPDGAPLSEFTRNGRAAVVVMEAGELDAERERQSRTRQLERAVYEGLIRGYKDVLAGDVTPLAEAAARIRARKGWEFESSFMRMKVASWSVFE